MSLIGYDLMSSLALYKYLDSERQVLCPFSLYAGEVQRKFWVEFKVCSVAVSIK